jgi:hypothetical protein
MLRRNDRPRPLRLLVGAAIGGWLALALAHAHGGPRAQPRARPRAGALRGEAPAVILRSPLADPTRTRGGSREPAPAGSTPNLGPDERDSALRSAHRALLRGSPLLQRLPYRGREIGISLVGMAGGGRPLLLVASRIGGAPARRDFDALIERMHDSARNYVVRYRRLR